MSNPQRVLAFDIGIRNLAWCLMEATGHATTPFRVIGWQNYDILSGTAGGAEATAAAAKVICHRCTATGVYRATTQQPTCQRHCPESHPPLRDLSGVALKRLPPLATLKAIVAATGLPTKGKAGSKAALTAALATRYSMPIEKLKLKKAVEHELTTIHDGIRGLVTANTALFRTATAILLENQPVLKNPTMKSVQILLFATLRDILQPSPPSLHLVHAGKKVKGVAAGDAGYKDRKAGSEARVEAALGLNTPAVEAAAQWLAVYRGHGKKSDIADAFCMCMDRLAPAPVS